jgi:hypothetical protein
MWNVKLGDLGGHEIDVIETIMCQSNFMKNMWFTKRTSYQTTSTSSDSDERDDILRKSTALRWFDKRLVILF